MPKKYLKVHNRIDALFYLVSEVQASIEAHSVHHFKVFHGDQRVYLWVFGRGRITSSTIATKSPGMAILKIMYKFDDVEEDHEPVEVDSSDYEALIISLATHHEMSGSEKIQSWQSSFLLEYEHANY